MISEAQIQAVVARIVEGYQPDRIILFGSYAYGVPHAASDLDLLIVKEETEDVGTRERRAAVAKLLRKAEGWQFDFDLVVLNAAETEEKAHDRFSREYVALRQGRHLHGPASRPAAIAPDAPLSQIERKTLGRWLMGAKHDLECAELMNAQGFDFDAVAKWSQVSAEKLLKARMMVERIIPPPGHDLELLFDALATRVAVPAEARQQAKLLAPFVALFDDYFFKMKPEPSRREVLAAVNGLHSAFMPAVESCLT